MQKHLVNYTLTALSVLGAGVGLFSCSNSATTTATISQPTAISVGTSHTCAVRSGQVKCWGSNAFGQLGDNTTTDHPAPTAPLYVAPRAMGVFASNSHSCALINGGVKCWGKNDVGQLGIGAASGTPTLYAQDTGITAGNNVIRLLGGNDFTCALISSGSLRCWGQNANGQFLNGATSASVPSPAAASLGVALVSVALGYNHGCGNPNGALNCWGLNSSGQLGDNTVVTPRLSLTAVPGYPTKADVQAVATGRDHSCALIQGLLYCWGANDSGQLGIGSTVANLLPTQVTAFAQNSIASIAAGNKMTCAVLTSGQVQCWGLNDRGQLGDGTTTSRISPTPVPGIGSVTQIAPAFEGHTCAVSNNNFYCWGAGTSGQLGNGALTNLPSPTLVSSF